MKIDAIFSVILESRKIKIYFISHYFALNDGLI